MGNAGALVHTAKYLASCSADGTIKLWNVHDESNVARWGMLVTTILVEHGRVMSCVWSSDDADCVSSPREHNSILER